MNGVLVTDAWIGDPDDPPLATSGQFTTASRLLTLAAAISVAIACGGVLLVMRW